MRQFMVFTGEVVESKKRHGLSIPMPVSKGFATLDLAIAFAQSIDAREVEEIEAIDKRNWRMIRTHYVPRLD